ncbi:cell division protein ZapE [Sphingomonas canadensis]|uniref:Cell division protein ZapE n=1 Tax=Sphingomonas canadensis TaxID=1219257 RepID=A0ABW3H536_9SPHN|nr:cell division protein ZapE [Sphingomonas canadensis]MCW3835324.1 cell division protein ZapE [Sphingomonas canadensis]
MTLVLERYHALAAAGELRADPEQAAAARKLERLAHELETGPRKGSVLWRLGRKPQAPQGIYLWGDVGRGKSMLMDLFFENVGIARKRRVHFHEFMLEVHERLKAERERDSADPVIAVAAAIAADIRLLAFDELVVNNPPDAFILARLFTELVAQGIAIVATSNRPPQDLYKHGLNRELFLPFIRLIEERMEVVALNGPTDYRLARLGSMRTWLVPNGPEATAALSAAFFRLTDYPPEDRAHVPACEIPVPGGRTLTVPKCLKGVAVFSFKRLCAEARGASDYLAIARRFHTVIIVGIPLLGPENRNEAARFVTLIDALYENKVKLLAAADAEPDALYAKGDGAFEFQRTASRLHEMGSDEYLALGHGEK